MLCSNCGSETSNESRHCRKCGSLTTPPASNDLLQEASTPRSEVKPSTGTKSTFKNVACGRCNHPISPGQGYSVYSDAIQGIAADRRQFFSTSGRMGTEKGDSEIRSVGAMLYCDDCASA